MTRACLLQRLSAREERDPAASLLSRKNGGSIPTLNVAFIPSKVVVLSRIFRAISFYFYGHAIFGTITSARSPAFPTFSACRPFQIRVQNAKLLSPTGRFPPDPPKRTAVSSRAWFATTFGNSRR